MDGLLGELLFLLKNNSFTVTKPTVVEALWSKKYRVEIVSKYSGTEGSD